MSFWRLAGESPSMQSLVVVTAGVATLVLTALLVQRWINRPQSRRMLWRAAWISASAWIVAECVGGNMLIAWWLSDATARLAMPHQEVALAELDERIDASSAPVSEPIARAPFEDVSWDTAQRSSSYEPVELSLELSAEVANDDAAPRGRESFSPQDSSTQPTQSENETPERLRYLPLILFAALTGSIVLALWFTGRRVVVGWFTWRHTSPASESVVELVEISHLAQRDAASSRGCLGSKRSGAPSGVALDVASLGARHPGSTPATRSGARRLRCRIVESRRLAAPVVYGALRPTLAVPAGFAQSLPHDQVEAVLAHELVHVLGRDPLWQVAFDALVTLLWWHPLSWLARSEHRAACEAAADAGAAALYGGSRALAAALVRLARHATDPRLGWAALDVSGRRRSRLGRRVLRLLREDGANRLPARRRRRGVTSAAACMLITLLLLGTALARCQVSELAFPKGEDPMTIWQTSWRSSLAVAAVAAMLGTSYADEAEEADESVAEEVAVELELVLDDAAEVTEGALEALLGLEPEIELLFTNEEEEEDEEEVEEEEEEEEEIEDDEEEAEDEAEEDEAEEDEGEEAQEEGIPSEVAKARKVAAAEIEKKKALVAKEIAMAKQELAKAKAQLAQERDRMAQQIQQIVAQAKAQAAQGGQDAQRQIMEQVQQLEQMQLGERGQRIAQRLARRPVVEFSNESDRRRHHLLQAAENLRAIGKNDLAEQLMQEANSIAPDEKTGEGENPYRAEVRIERRGPGDAGDEGEEQRIRALGALNEARAEARARAVEARERRANGDELRAEMNELRSQVNDMRAMLEKVVERLENQSPSAPR
jgi:hypothetical protein